MSEKLVVFVSSVQKELEDERLIVQNLVNTDAFLSAHCAPVLYEFEPASPERLLRVVWSYSTAAMSICSSSVRSTGRE